MLLNWNQEKWPTELLIKKQTNKQKNYQTKWQNLRLQAMREKAGRETDQFVVFWGQLITWPRVMGIFKGSFREIECPYENPPSDS